MICYIKFNTDLGPDIKRMNGLKTLILVANNFINIAIVILFAYLGNFLFEGISSSVLKFILEVVFHISTFQSSVPRRPLLNIGVLTTEGNGAKGSFSIYLTELSLG